MKSSIVRGSATFWTAFIAGLAAPVGVYARPVDYAAYGHRYSVQDAFGIAGLYWSAAASQVPHVGQFQRASAV